MSFIDRRAHERVQYAASERPALRVAGATYEVLDCSERGLLIARTDDALVETGLDIQGTIRFPTGVEVTVEGVVVRAQEDAIAIQFTGLWIPRDVILAEQRRLRQGLAQ
ncbi:MAG: PilZ domain-containing protein [Gemmatimonadaceae bacterium]